MLQKIILMWSNSILKFHGKNNKRLAGNKLSNYGMASCGDVILGAKCLMIFSVAGTCRIL